MIEPAPSPRIILFRQACTFAGALAAYVVWGGAGLFVLCLILAAFFLFALFAPRAFAPVGRVQERLLGLVLAGFTWLVMVLLFTLFFIPARLVLLVRGLRRNTPAESGWRAIPRDAENRFTSQF